jgi:polyphosphate kinase
VKNNREIISLCQYTSNSNNKYVSTMSVAAARFDKRRQSNVDWAKRLEMLRQDLDLTTLQA